MCFSFRTWFFSWFLNSFFCLGSVFASFSLRYFCHYHLALGFGLRVSGFPVFIFSVTVLGVCWYVSLYICWWIFCISTSQDQPFFIIVLTWSASLWFVVLYLANSVQMSINIFLYPPSVGFLLKWQYSACLLSSQVNVLLCRLWLGLFICSSFVYLE